MQSVKKRNTYLILLCWLVYVSTYLGKYSYNANINQIEPFFNVNHDQSGLVSSLFFFSYGAGQIVHGLFSKRYNARCLIPFALLISAAINIIVRFLSVFYPVKYLWLLNGFTLSLIWPLIVKTMAQNIESENFDKALMIIGTTTPVGLTISYGLSSLFIKIGNFRAIFTVGFFVLIIAAALWFFISPKLALGLCGKSKQGFSSEVAEKQVQSSDGVLTAKNLVFYISVLAVLSAIGSIIREGIGVWFPSILIEGFGFDESVSVILSLLLPLLGILGNTLGIWFNKKVKDYILFGIIFMAAATVTIFAGYIGFTQKIVAMLIIGSALTSCILYGFANIMTGKVPMCIPNKKNSGVMAGVMNGSAYVGSTITSYGLGVIADKNGFDGALLSLVLTGVCSVIVFSVVFAIYKLTEKAKIKKL
ncbi:MAG: MFS transporter [Candidatus Borkfalkiaceae bacterium]|nr:MFS transporter [Christensenellaceae bacterium]